MSPYVTAILVIITLSAVGVAGDYFLKVASESAKPFFNGHFFAGLVIYALTAFGWVIVLKHMKLAQVGVFYSVSIVIFLTALGYFQFNETLKPREIVGVVLAITSLLLLSRFSE